jgi:asparagine synthase (glutamine-hydrolysing)
MRAALGRMLDSVPASTYDSVLRHLPFRVLADQVHKFAAIVVLDNPRDMYRFLATQWPDAMSLVKGATPAGDFFAEADSWPTLRSPLASLLLIETMTSLPDDMLVKVDRASMAVGLETRVPLVDARVVEFAYGLPDHFKVRGHTGKWILRRLLDRYVPRHLVNRPKTGFSVPLDTWLCTSLRDWAESLLAPDRLRQEGFLDPVLVRRRWEEHISGRRKWQYQLWSVLMFEAWLDHQRQNSSATGCTASELSVGGIS